MAPGVGLYDHMSDLETIGLWFRSRVHARAQKL